MTPRERKNIEHAARRMMNDNLSNEWESEQYSDYLTMLPDDELLTELNWQYYINCSEEDENLVINKLSSFLTLAEAEAYCKIIHLGYQKIDGKLTVCLNHHQNKFTYLN